MRPLLFWGIAKGGRVKPDDPGPVARKLQKWEGKRVLVKVEPEAEGKTLQQLRYTFGVALPEWAEFLGYDEDDLYEAVLETCMPKRERVNVLTGEVLWYTPRLSEATKDEASEMLDRMIRQAASTGFEIRPPALRP